MFSRVRSANTAQYPKARHHFLVMPTRRVDGFSTLSRNDLALLDKMIACGHEIGAETGVPFRLGFHAKPSMRQLHLHCISTDFDSPCLKNRKHWNSFTSEFFVPASAFRDMLEQNNQVQVTRARARANRCLLIRAVWR
jgi:aprataxin